MPAHSHSSPTEPRTGSPTASTPDSMTRRVPAEAEPPGPEPVAVNDDWRHLVVREHAPHVHPVTAWSVDTEGEPPASGLLDGPTVRTVALHTRSTEALTMTTAGTGTTIVLDFGRQVIGFVEIAVRSLVGASLRISYSQFREHLSPDGDGMAAPFGTDAHPWSRVDRFDPDDVPAELRSPGKREFRYAALTLDGPGTALIDHMRVRQTIYPVVYDSHFLTSDPLINRAWYHGAYTGELASVTEDGSPWMLTTPFDRVLFMADLHMQGLAGYSHSSDYRWLMRNSLERFGTIQNPDGSLPAAASHLVTPTVGDPGPPDGWRAPDEGPDPDHALGFVGPYSLHRDVRIDSFTAFWVAALADYHLYADDPAFVLPLLPVARRAIEFLEGRTTSDGLFYEPEDQSIDPASPYPFVANWSPGDAADGVDSFSNSVFHNALRGLALLEEDVAGRTDAAAALRDRAEDLRQSMMEHLWDEDAGAMVLNLGDPMQDHTGDAVAGALVFELLDSGQRARTLEFLDRELASPFGTLSSQFPDNPYRQANIQGYIAALDALGRVRAGDGTGAVSLIRRWWQHMLDSGPGTGWFAWENDGTIDREGFANSPWTTPLPALVEGVLGIRPLRPGFRQWRIAPQPSGLEWAQGRVPIPRGGLSSRWEYRGGDFVLTTEAPDHTVGIVRLPAPAARGTVTMDGSAIWERGRPTGRATVHSEGEAIIIAAVRGDHTFVVKDSGTSRLARPGREAELR